MSKSSSRASGSEFGTLTGAAPVFEHLGVPGTTKWTMTVEFDTTAVASLTTTATLPDNCVVNGLHLFTAAGLTFVTGTSLIIGSAANPDLLGEIVATSVDGANDVWANTAIMASPVAIGTGAAVQIGPGNNAGGGASVLAGTVAGAAKLVLTGIAYDDIAT